MSSDKVALLGLVDVAVVTKNGAAPSMASSVKWQKLCGNTYFGMLPADQVERLSKCADVEKWRRLENNVHVPPVLKNVTYCV